MRMKTFIIHEKLSQVGRAGKISEGVRGVVVVGEKSGEVEKAV
jgi:hypothetical protein